MPKTLTSGRFRHSSPISRVHRLLNTVLTAGLCCAGSLLQACQTTESPTGARPDVVIESPADAPRPPFEFSPSDQQFLDRVQRGAFLYLWNEVSPTTGMVRDRSSSPVISIAGVGFQLSGIPIGIERGWITRDQGLARATLILESLLNNPANRKAGLFYHFLDPVTAGPASGAYEHTVSTIDSALLFAGVITAGNYFGGGVESLSNRIIREANWRFFVLRQSEKPYEIGYISLGWQPGTPADPTGEGTLLPYVWADSGDEHRLVMFLAAAAPSEEFRVDPALYYRLRRQLGDAGTSRDPAQTVVWFPWSGALFTGFFAHCWINYSAMEPDDPAAFGAAHRARVDWWENSRRLARMHERKCRDNPLGLPTFGPDAWGLSASDAPGGYAVPGLFPEPLPMPGATPQFDFSTFTVHDNFGDGTLAPYAAGCCIMFSPRPAIAALRHYLSLARTGAAASLWREPDGKRGNYGFQDAFNLGKQWVAPDCVAIDQGPLLLAIENARTGRVWQWFESDKGVVAAYERLRFAKRASGAPR